MSEKIDNIFESNLSTQDKGTIGEDWILDELSNFINYSPNSEVRKVSGMKEVGDIYLRFGNLICCIESKNHTGTIRIDQIVKFKRDLCDNMYNCGLFISLKSDIVQSSGIQHFDIKIENNKPCVYLTNLAKRHEHLQLAIRILTYLVKNIKQNTYNNVDYIEKLKEQIKLNFNLENNINTICKNVSEMKILLNKNKQNLNMFLGNEESNTKNINRLICECEKDFKNKGTLSRHRKKCVEYKNALNIAQE